ncbi:hypothetical protein J3458_018741 [Metarhizium acridum]|uniref:uncharacterized protein n=1 Tax=Metarhizium acridum TaxID=92637 RepID=UPI001C6BE5B6|nr:hypothetical protein J3458_018741 [Metarhizium acridum]
MVMCTIFLLCLKDAWPCALLSPMSKCTRMLYPHSVQERNKGQRINIITGIKMNYSPRPRAHGSHPRSTTMDESKQWMALARCMPSREAGRIESPCISSGMRILKIPDLGYSRPFCGKKAQNGLRSPTSNPQPNSTTSHCKVNKASPTCLFSRLSKPNDAPSSMYRQGHVRIRLVVAEPYDRLFSQLGNDEQPSPTPSEQLWENVNARRPSRNAPDTRPLQAQQEDAQIASEQFEVNRRAVLASRAGQGLLEGMSGGSISRCTPLEADSCSSGAGQT